MEGMTPERFKTEALLALQTAKIQWDDKPILVEGVPRPCENRRDADGLIFIHCHRGDYIESVKLLDQEGLYRFVAHEYFAGVGLEPNRFERSDYFYSEQVVLGLHDVLVKRWSGKVPTKKRIGLECQMEGYDGLQYRRLVLQAVDGKARVLTYSRSRGKVLNQLLYGYNQMQYGDQFRRDLTEVEMTSLGKDTDPLSGLKVSGQLVISMWKGEGYHFNFSAWAGIHLPPSESGLTVELRKAIVSDRDTPSDSESARRFSERLRKRSQCYLLEFSGQSGGGFHFDAWRTFMSAEGYRDASGGLPRSMRKTLFWAAGE
jgi:hypothetical protein